MKWKTQQQAMNHDRPALAMTRRMGPIGMVAAFILASASRAHAAGYSQGTLPGSGGDLDALYIASGVALLLGGAGAALYAAGRIKLPTLLLAWILLLAAVLRLNHIAQPYVDAYSWRQTSTAMMAENFYRTNTNIFYPEVNWSGPGPSYQGREFQTVSYLAALLYRLFGQQDWIGRAVAIAFGLWGIFALHQLIACVWDRPRALAGAAVMAVMPSSIFIERSFLPDPAMVALVTTSLWLLVVYLQTDRLGYLVAATLVGIWGCASKLPGLIIGLPMIYATVTILHQRHAITLRRTGLLILCAFLALVPVTAYYLWARHLAETYPPHHFAGSGNWIWGPGFQSWLKQQFFLPELARTLALDMWAPVIFGLTLVGVLLQPPAGQQPGQARWIFHWWLIAAGIYYLLGARELLINPWNLHILAPPAAALAAHTLVTMGRAEFRAFFPGRIGYVLPVAVFALLLWFSSSTLEWLYKDYAWEDYILGRTLDRVSDDDELVVTMGRTLGNPVSIYYSGQRGWIFPPPVPDQAWTDLLNDPAATIAALDELRAQGADWFGLVDDQRDILYEAYPELAAYLAQTSEVELENDEVLIYDLTPDDHVLSTAKP